jgi:hypothetical protein
LLACHVVRDSGCGWLLAYWQGEQHQRVHGGDFARDAGVELSGAGFVADVKLPRPSLWKRVPWKDAVLTAAALVGAFFAFRDIAAGLFARPDVSVQFSVASEYIEVVGNSETWVPVTITSKVPYASTAVDRMDATVEPKPPGKSWSLVPDTAAVPPRLSPGQGAPARVRVALKHSKPGGPPEVYELSVKVAATAGWFPGQDTFPAHHPMRVWSPTLVASVPVLTGTHAHDCNYRVLLYPPSDYKDGLKLTIGLTASFPEVSEFNVDGDLSETPEKGVHPREILTNPLSALREFPIGVTLMSNKGFLSGECRKMQNQIEVNW